MTGEVSVGISGNYAFVAGRSGLVSIDVTNKIHPIISDYDPLGANGRYRQLIIDDDYAYVSMGGIGLMAVVDISAS